MKKKLLSLLLAVAIMVTSVSMGFGAIGAVAVSSKDVGVSFAVENKQATSSSPSTNIKVTVGSNYKVRIKSVTPTVINSSAGTADVSVSYTPNSTVLTNNGIMTVNVSNFSANANTAIRYVITYDILDSSGNAVWTNKTNLAYGVVSQNTEQQGPVGEANTQPSGKLFEWSFVDSYNRLRDAQAPNKIYVQQSSASFTTYIDARRGATGTNYCDSGDVFYGKTTSGTAPSTVSYSNVPLKHFGYKLTSNQSTTTGPHTWLSWSTPASGYYSWNYDMVAHCDTSNSSSISNDTGSVILYYRNGTDKTAATTALEGCANLQKDNYTAASWAALESAMDKAAQVAYAVPGANEGYKIACQTAASVASAVTNAKNGLVFEKANWDAAFNAYVAAFTNDANGKKIIVGNAVEIYTYAAGPDSTTYGTTTVAKYEKTAADAFLAWSDEPMKHYDANDINRYDQHTVDGYTTKLINDYANLPFADAVYTYLDIATEEYKSINKDFYYEEAWSAYENAVNAAKGLPRDLKTDSQKKINDALKFIIEKKNQLAYNLKPATTTELYIQIGSATAILNEYNHPLGNKLLYTLPDFDKVWEIFEERYNAAIEATDYTIDKQGEVDKAAADLAAVISSLAKYRVLDVTELNRVCGLRPEYNDSSKYVPESYNLWSELRAEGVLFVNKATPKDGYAEKTYENYDEMERLTAAIQNAYDNLEKVKADFTNLNAAIARIPSDDVLALYEDDYVNAIKGIVATIDYGATFDEQSNVDEITDNLNAAIDELIPAHYKGANYDDVEKAKAEAEAINKQIVTNYSIVTDAINAVDWNKKIVDQDEVDAMAAAIRKAIEDLKYISADYDDVRAAIAEAEAIENTDWYANYYKVEEAIDAVDWNVTIDKQAEVDAMAAAIREAIGNLKLGDADYSGIKKAIADYNAKAPFTDFYPETVAAVDQAIAKVEYGLKANEQDRVNAMKDDIVDAIEAMQLLPADYSRLEATIAYAQKLESKKYENYSIVTDAIDAVVWTLNCRQNAEMLAQIAAINDAVAQLKLLPADYDDVRAAIDAARYACQNGEYPYTQESIDAVEAVIESINWDYDIEHQADVDAYITKIQIAVAQLTKIRADYNALDIVKAKYDNLQRDLYASLSAVDAYVAKIDWTKTIDKQSEVDTYVAELDAMLENLEYAPADYSAVDNAILIYNSIEEDYYEDYDIAVVKQVIESVERGLKKNEQDRVNQMAQDINNAIAELMTKMKKADLTALNNAVDDAMAKYKEMSETGYGIDRDTLIPLETLLAAASGYDDDTTIDKQNDIDVLTEKIIAATENLEYEFTKILDGTGLVIKDGYIYGFEEGSFSDDARELIKFVGAAELKIIETKNGFGTGTIIQFISTKDGSVIETYTVLVFGDANGDAVIDMFDVAYIAEIANEGSQPSDMLLRALDIFKDGTLDTFDVSMIISLANLDYTLMQDGSMGTY